MSAVVITVGFVSGVAVAALWIWRRADHRRDVAEMKRLLATQPQAPAAFDPAMVAGLPGPARRFFEFAIQPGTPLCTVAQITMAGQFGMGTGDDPRYREMTATQVLAAPEGFVWKMRAGRGLMRLSGSDSATWTRFWFAGLAPVARLGGTQDHRRSAFGRCVAEALFWTPAALLPHPGVQWSEAGEDTARVTVSYRGLSQSVDLTVDALGRPLRVVFPRWSDANPDKLYRTQPFGGYLSQYREFQGFRLPTHVEAGKHFGTPAYFAFFVVDVSDIRFPAPTR